MTNSPSSSELRTISAGLGGGMSFVNLREITKNLLRNEMLRIEELIDDSDSPEDLSYEDELNNVETAFIHVDRCMELTAADKSIIDSLMADR